MLPAVVESMCLEVVRLQDQTSDGSIPSFSNLL